MRDKTQTALHYSLGRRFVRRFPRTTAVIVGCVFSAILLLLLELIAACMHRSNEHIITNGANSLKVKDAVLGFKLEPNRRATYISTCDMEIMSEKEYTTDAYGRRVTPVTMDDKRERFIVFLGCSFTFGQGCADNETLPYYVGEAARGYMPYNYAVGGYGPQQALLKLRSGTLRSEIKESKGICVYVYLPCHIDRAIGGMTCLNGWGSRFPYFYLNDNRLVLGGSFEDGRPWTSRFYHIAGKSNVLRLLDITFPLWYTTAHYDLVAAILREQRDCFIAQFPDSQFCVLIYNRGLGRKKWLAARLAADNIEVLEASDILIAAQEKYGRPLSYEDGHPLPESHKIVADYLVDRLGIRN